MKEKRFTEQESKDRKKLRDAAWRSANRHKRKEYYYAHKEKELEGMKKWQSENRERVRKTDYAYRHKDWAKRQAQARASFLKNYHNFTPEQYEALLIKQDGKCAICATPQEKLTRGLFIDHCHNTDKRRGLLCQQCNFAIGHAKDNIKRLKQMIKYLEAYER